MIHLQMPVSISTTMIQDKVLMELMFSNLNKVSLALSHLMNTAKTVNLKDIKIQVYKKFRTTMYYLMINAINTKERLRNRARKKKICNTKSTSFKNLINFYKIIALN